MKRIVSLAAVSSMFLTILGCATNPQESSMDRLADDRQQLDQVRGRIDRVIFALDSLMRAPASEIAPAQERYAGDVEALREAADSIAENARKMRLRTIDYLTEWERAQLTVENEELKQATEQRQKEVVQRLSRLESTLRRASEGVEPLIEELEDIDLVTRNDPTPAGIAGVQKSGIVQSARKHAATANYRLDLAAVRFDSALASLSPQPGTQPLATAAASTQTAPAASATLPSFGQADRNASGAVESEEVLSLLGFDFQSADRDNDDKLSESEYESAVKSSKSPSTIGASPSPQ
jgi:hypothetical protein